MPPPPPRGVSTKSIAALVLEAEDEADRALANKVSHLSARVLDDVIRLLQEPVLQKVAFNGPLGPRQLTQLASVRRQFPETLETVNKWFRDNRAAWTDLIGASRSSPPAHLLTWMAGGADERRRHDPNSLLDTITQQLQAARAAEADAFRKWNAFPQRRVQPALALLLLVMSDVCRRHR
jgi:hypothetical protein